MSAHYKVVNKGEVVNVHIHPDDHVSLVFKKLAFHLKVQPSDIYVWVQQPVVGTWQLQSFVQNIFKGDNLIDLERFTQAFENCFGSTPKGGTVKMLTREAATKLVRKQKVETITQPVGHYFMDGEYVEYLPYNPSSSPAAIEANVDSLYLHSQMNMTLESVVGAMNKLAIHVATRNQTVTNTRLFFPFDKLPSGDLNTLIPYLEEGSRQFSGPVDPKKVQTTSFLTVLHLKSKPLKDVGQDLSAFFNDIHASEEVPFIKYKARTNVYFKANKRLLAGVAEVRDFEKWYDVNSFRMQENTYLLFKVRYGIKGFITLVLNDKLQFDIRLSFYVKDEERIENLKSMAVVANRAIKSYGLPVPEFPEDTGSLMSEFEVYRFATFNVATLEAKASKAFAESFVTTKMFHYFDVIPSEAADTLRLQYKKVDNFSKSENISMFIQRHGREPRDEVLQKVVDFFLVAKEEAENEYERWELQRESGEVEKIKYERFVDVKLRFNSPVDVRFVVSGATSVQQQERIVMLVGHLLAASKGRPKETKKDAEVRRIAEEEANAAKFIAVDTAGVEDDDDDDWLVELKEIENEFGKPKEDDKKLATPKKDVDGDFKVKGFVKRMLDSADRDLFNYKTEGAKRHDYASMCGWVDRRQPVVITAEEKRVIDERYQGAYEGYVKSGSTPDLERRYFYICPKVWCPRSRVAVPPKLYSEKGNEACPMGEEPIVFESKSFWGLGDKSFDRKHVPGFLAKHTRQDGLCLPCCFKIAPNEGNRNKQRHELCVPKADENEDVPSDDVVGAEKYIKSDSYFPLENGRYGLLPKQLHEFLGKRDCGSRYNGTGLMTDKTDCYLRKGIFHGTQSFVQCVLQCLDNPAVRGYKEFVDALNKNLTISQFIALENGKILQLFVDRTRSIFSSDFKEFKEWLLNDNDYVSRFNLLKLQKELKDTATFTKGLAFYKDIIREFMIFYSFKNFVAFMNTPDIEKDHRILLDLFNITTDWLNINEYNIVLLDVDGEGKVHIDCSLNRDTHQFVNKKTPFVFLVKQGRFYEPLCHVKTASNEDVQSNTKFILGEATKSHPRVADMVRFYYNNCKTPGSHDGAGMEVSLYLESKGYKPKYYVIDYDFRLCGLLLTNNLFVPFLKKKDVFALHGLRFVYISDVVLFKCLEEKSNIVKVYKLLKDEYGEAYNIVNFVSEKGTALHGMVLSSGAFVPLNIRSGTAPFKGYTDDLYLFVNEEEEDERKAFVREIVERSSAVRRIVAAFDAGLTEEKRIEVMFLRDAKNPLPIDFRRAKVIKLMKEVIEEAKIEKADLNEAADNILNKFYDAKRRQFRRFQTRDDEVLFDFNDVQQGRLQEVVEKAQNPYKLFHKKLNEVFDKYVFEYEAKEDDAFDGFINSASTFADVPVKYGTVQYRKLLKGFVVLEGTSENDILYKLFSATSKVTKKTTALSEVVLKNIVKTNVVKDFKAKTLSGMGTNPSYVQHMKKMKIKEPTLDAVLEVIDSIYYHPSFYEIRVLARAVDVNVILIGRQTLRNPEGLFEVIYTKSPFYLFIVQSFDRFKGVDCFEPIVKNKKDILIGKNDLPTEIIELINSYMTRFSKQLPSTDREKA